MKEGMIIPKVTFRTREGDEVSTSSPSLVLKVTFGIFKSLFIIYLLLYINKQCVFRGIYWFTHNLPGRVQSFVR